MNWDIGDVYPATATFRNAAGALANPTTVTLQVQAPDGTITTPTPSSASTGIWTYALALTQGGNWVIVWTGTGAVAALEPLRLYVRPSLIRVTP